MTTIEQLAGITAQHNEIVKRVVGGSLDATAVKRALQDIIEGKLSMNRSITLGCCGEQIVVDDSLLSQPWIPKSWFRGYKRQWMTAEQNWPTATLPAPPAVFRPRTKSAHPLGHVPDMFDSLWDKVVAPEGYTKYWWEGVQADKQNLHLAAGKVEFAAPVWLAFDPERGKGERPDSFWGQADLAASEVFSALIQFPEWPLAWFNGASAPNLSGYQLKYDGSWSNVPYLHRWDDDRRLELSDNWADYRNDYWSSPSVREC